MKMKVRRLKIVKWTIGWGAVPYCNMNCEFCYSKNVRTKENMLPLSDWISFISSNYPYIENINYGTGENTMSDDWYDLIYYVSNNHPDIKQALTTNGYISQCVKENFDKAKKFFSSIDEVDVSIDFFEKEKHNLFRGQELAYDWAMDSLKMCKEHGINVTLVFIGMNDTLTERNLSGLFEIAGKYDIKLRMNIYRPTNGINHVSNKYIVDYHILVNALKWISKNHSVLSIDDALFSAILTENSIQLENDNSLRILHDGSITPSTYLITKEFRKHSIKEDSVLKNIKMSDLGLERFVPQKCEQCSYVNRCGGGVYDRRYLWYGSFKERDPYCPYNQKEKSLPDFKINLTNSDSISSIHHGYLPTMFFKY